MQPQTTVCKNLKKQRSENRTRLRSQIFYSKFRILLVIKQHSYANGNDIGSCHYGLQFLYDQFVGVFN